MAMYLAIFSLLFISFSLSSSTTDTTCEDSQKHFANLCFAPRPDMGHDIKWAQANQPEEGWHVEDGNDIIRLHFAEVLKGQLFTLHDNFEDACIRIKIEHVSAEEDGGVYGFGNLTAQWNCTMSQDTVGLFLCDMHSSGPSKYHENFNMYFIYGDNKNLSIAIYCFPNGQVGWAALTITQHLSEEEEKIVSQQIKSLGFYDESTVSLHGENCPKIL